MQPFKTFKKNAIPLEARVTQQPEPRLISQLDDCFKSTSCCLETLSSSFIFISEHIHATNDGKTHGILNECRSIRQDPKQLCVKL